MQQITLIFIRQARGQDCLSKEFYPELGGFRLKVLVLFLDSFIAKECSFGGGGERVGNPTMVGYTLDVAGDHKPS